ncbi:MAG: carboxylesterase/lipase family protein [Acidobacteriaceae bacterium]
MKRLSAKQKALRCFPAAGIAALAVGLALSCVLQSAAADAGHNKNLRVKTKQGKIEGKEEGPARAFLGIPYAAPPLGQLRWQPPMPAAKWKGVRQATEFGSRCMQEKLYADMIFRDPGPSEDCLTLNVWTPPAADKKSKLPVMVWIYGGGYVTGGTSEPRQDGANLSKNGVVVVSMNYRLGIFGFFADAELAKESDKGAAGNYGLMDQTAALRWVKDNIAAFGGDPSNVTLFGESAGSFSVSTQMASPLARGLFQRAIGESGGAFARPGIPDVPLKQAEAQDAAFARAMLGADTLEQLRAIPAQKLLEASLKKAAQGKPLRFGPDVDGYLLPESVPAIFAAAKQSDVPLLVGWNRDEGGFSGKTTVESFRKDVETQFGANAPEILRLYPSANDAQAARSAADLAGDNFIVYSTWKWMEAQVATGKKPVYRYRFDLAPPAGPNEPGNGQTAYHSSEISYVFGNLDLLSGFAWRPEDRALSEQMQKYWTNFARTGDPNGGDLVKWPVYAAATGWQVLHLQPQPEAEPDQNRQRYLLLERIWDK